MLKIKDEIPLVILVGFGFIRKDDNTFCKKVYLKNENDDKNFYEIDITTREIKLLRLDGELDNTLFDLIEAGIVEKVYSKKKSICMKADNSCRDEKLTCKGCYYNKFILNSLFWNKTDYISKDKIKELQDQLFMQLGSYVKDESTPKQERIAGGINIINKILEG